MSAVGEPARTIRLGRYELITRIGQGGMADVQLALQRGPAGFEKLVVVKLVHNNLASQKAFVDMLLDEARVAALVKHPNVVDIYDLGQADGRYFIAMEYLEGEPLLAVLRAGREGKRLDALSMGRLIADTAEGLDAAHELRSMSGERLELVHHDISLGNIVVLYNGQVKLVDFGVAKATQAGSKSKVQGKFSYMAPEKLKGDSGDRRSDIFSLGCVMWEALTLKRLFRGGNDSETMKQVLEMAIQPPSKVNPEVPPEYDAIVMRSLDRDPKRRHGTAKELAVEIEELLRKRGYGGKNDKIAKYMQETFREHIDARKKLVQEVVSKGSASAEVLDAAFASPEVASGSPAMVAPAAADFSVKSYRRLTPPAGVPALAPAWAESSKPTQIDAPRVVGDDADDDDEENNATVVVQTKGAPASPPARAALPGPSRSKSTTSTVPPPSPIVPAKAPAPRAPTASEPTEIDAVPMADVDGPEGPLVGPPIGESMYAGPRVGTVAEALGDKKRYYIMGLVGAALLLVIAVVVKGGGGSSAAKKTVVDDGSANGSAVVADHGAGSGSGSDIAVTPDVGSGSASADTGSGSGSGSSAVIEMDPTDGSGSDKKPPKTDKTGKTDKSDKSGPTDKTDHQVVTPPPPKVDVEETVNKGLQAFVKGDAKGALALLLKAKSAKPGYAPTYRVLGRVYKKLGDNGSAKKAFQSYLKLSPTAPDADMIKEEIKKL